MLSDLSLPPQIVLATSSTYRRKQFAQLGIAFTTAEPNIDETSIENESAASKALRLSLAKAEMVASKTKNKNIVVIGSDQTADIEGEILGKPLSHENAISQLHLCKGKTVTFYSGLALLDCRNNTSEAVTVRTDVKFRLLSHAEISTYVKKDNPIYAAGSFKCESLGLSLFDYVRSDDPSALIGLPLIALNKMLLNAKINTLLTS